MKKTLLISLGTVAAIATASAGTLPPTNPIIPDDGGAACGLAGLTGDLTVGIGYTSLDGNALGGGEEDEFASAYAELQLASQFGNYYVQADVFAEGTDVGGASDSYQDGFGGALHIMRQDLGLGVFVGGFSTDQDDNDTDTSDRWFAGLEGLLSRAEADYYAQVGYVFGNGGDDSNGEDSFTDTVFVRLAAQRQLASGLVLAGEIGGAWGEMDSSADDFELYTAGLSISKPINECFTVGLGYQYTYYDQDEENEEIDEHFLGLSLTYAFGSGTNNNLGTPDFLRWSGISGGQLE